MDPTLVAVAVIAAVPTTLTGWWTYKTHKTVKGNGHGNVTAIVERIEGKVDAALSWQGAHEAQHVRLEHLESH